MENSTQFFERRSKLLPDSMAKPVIVAAQAQGSKIVDIEGREYIDFISGIGVMALGHCHEKINHAIKNQIDHFSHTCFGIVGYQSYLDLAENMIRLFPHHPDYNMKEGNTKVFLTNSGSDSVENAIKVARSYTGRSGIISFTHAFHGRHYMSMTLTDKPQSRKFCGPLPSDIHRLRFPSYFHYGRGQSRLDYLKEEIANLQNFFKDKVNPEEIAAVIFEPIQGEGGFMVMPPEYLSALQVICNKYKILIIVDEVQSGLGRTGKWSAYQHYHNFYPDLSTWAKAMGGGYPLGAVMGKKEIMDGIPPGILGGTFMGNPVACTAGNATITYMKEINLPAMASEKGEIIRKKLNALYETYDSIGEVRGLGAMMAIEFCRQRDPNQPDPKLCKELIQNCREAGLLLLSAGPKANVLRILSPLNIEVDIIEQGLDILEQELNKIMNKRA